MTVSLIKKPSLTKWSLCPCLLVSVFLACLVRADHHAAGASIEVETLLRDMIQGGEGKEVIVSRVSFPPHTQLPWHWHPGEEVFYVIEGSVILKRRSQPDVLSTAGDVQKIAPEILHAGETRDTGAELVIFRLHTAGEPERYLVE